MALTRFKRTLPWARLYVREMTHTLHLPPAHAELYGGPHADWLRDILERLPRLQSLVVNELAFFDHASLLTLRYPGTTIRSSTGDDVPMYGLRLLEASFCSNATSTGLREAVRHFPALISLDLSKTRAARAASVLKSLSLLHGLRVLKLRGLDMDDDDMCVVAAAIGTRVKSLDIRDNRLTDRSARILLEHCFKPRSTWASDGNRSHPHRDDCSLHLDRSKDEHIDRHIRRRLTHAFVNRLMIEDVNEDGVTHLYISNNNLTVEGVSGFLRSGRLYVLDAGTLENAARRLSASQQDSMLGEDLNMPGEEKLTPLLSQWTSRKLTYLRINHAVITKEMRKVEISSGRAELEGETYLSVPEEAHELDADQTLYELPGSSPLVELPGNSSPKDKAPVGPPSMNAMPVRFIGQPGNDKTPRRLDKQPSYDSEFSPNTESIVLSASGSGLSPAANSIKGVQHQPAASDGTGSVDPYYASPSPRIENMRAHLDLRQSEEQHLHPGMLPKLRTLVLTGIPAHTADHDVPRRLIQFINDCAEECEIAKLSARATYALPPGRNRQLAEREYADSLFALQRIVLEVAPLEESLKANKKPSSGWRRYPTKASTEDPDSETFWAAAEHDFSFFGDEECGLPSLEPGSTLPLAAMSGKMVVTSDSETVPPHPQAQHQQVRQPEQRTDVIAEISRFRKERKGAFEAALRRGERDPSVEGYWPGDIAVVRPQIDLDRTRGSVDYYGNYFEKGYMYP